MDTTKEFLIRFMKEQSYPEDAIKCFLELHDRIEANEDWRAKTNKLVNDIFNDLLFEDIKKPAEEIGTHEYTYVMLYFMYCARILEKHYEESGISHDIYLKSMNDLKCKLIECKNVYDIWGTFVGFWFPPFFKLRRFGLGRFQFEKIPFPKESYTKCGYTVNNGDIVYNIHIPSSGPITEDLRIDSYKKAYEFYKDEIKNKPMVIVCHSWLLYKGNEEFLPMHSNIRAFMSDFDIIESEDSDNFGDAWRVFGREGLLPVDNWQVNTSLQKAFKDRVLNKGKTGLGFGVLLFDGDKIIK